MGILDFLRPVDINEGAEEYKASSDAVLLDVRTPQEYAEGHIPDSINVPLDLIGKISGAIDDKLTPLLVYCYSGARSSAAVDMLKKMGYENAKNIGGIVNYRGEIEK